MTGADRETIYLHNHDQAIAGITAVVGRVAKSVEFAYDRADGPPLREDEEPSDTEAIAWTATAQLRPEIVARTGAKTLVGSKVVEPGGSHPDGVLGALLDLAEQLGLNVTVVDMR